MSPQSQAERESACHSVPRCLRNRTFRKRQAASEGAACIDVKPVLLVGRRTLEVHYYSNYK